MDELEQEKGMTSALLYQRAIFMVMWNSQGLDMLSVLGRNPDCGLFKRSRRLELSTERPDLRKILVVWIPRCMLLAGNVKINAGSFRFGIQMEMFMGILRCSRWQCRIEESWPRMVI